jgi:hypothetical protein
MEVGGQRHAPAASPPGKRPGTHCTGAWVGPNGRSGRVRKISPPPGFLPQTVQPVVNRYTHYTLPAHFGMLYSGKNKNSKTPVENRIPVIIRTYSRASHPDIKEMKYAG